MTVGRTERCRGWIDMSELPVWRRYVLGRAASGGWWALG